MRKTVRSLDEIRTILKKHESELREKYGVKRIGIFGSIVRGEAGEESDVDILVEFERPIGLLKFLELEEYMSNLIGMKVDLVSKKALKPHIGKYILEEVVMV
ncbi:MAG: nucleotidyltransferase family protein [Candidatus Korarchaeota archaeon]|nr:nucleotidyltransferase family protein [Candidatus Korarchaeota archaeon]